MKYVFWIHLGLTFSEICLESLQELSKSVLFLKCFEHISVVLFLLSFQEDLVIMLELWMRCVDEIFLVSVNSIQPEAV
jgi:hypothetical protein